MDILYSFILGIVQGLTEFIPVSSSGHLVAVPQLLNWPDPGLAFDVMLHLGTLTALIVYFRKDCLMITKELFLTLTSFLYGIAGKNRKYEPEEKLGFHIIIATLPAVIVGLFLENIIAEYFRDIAWVGIFLILSGCSFLVVEKYYKKLGKKKDIKEINWRDALVVGLFQTIALLPGVSRSGMTISGGMLRGLERTMAARFSFLMSILAILGAGTLEGIKLIQNNNFSNQGLEILTGFAAALITGYLSIKFLLNFLKKHPLNIFALYIIILGIILLLLKII